MEDVFHFFPLTMAYSPEAEEPHIRCFTAQKPGSAQNMPQKSSVNSAYCRLTFARQHYLDITTIFRTPQKGAFVGEIAGLAGYTAH